MYIRPCERVCLGVASLPDDYPRERERVSKRKRQEDEQKSGETKEPTFVRHEEEARNLIKRCLGLTRSLLQYN